MRTTRSTRVAPGLLVLLLVAGCVDGDDGTPDAGTDAGLGPEDAAPPPDLGADAAAPPDAGPPELLWGFCGAGEPGDCARVEVPLFWDRPDDARRVRLRVRRLRAGGRARGQLWLLAGGPGETADSFSAVGHFRGVAPDLDIYLLDHRGTGRSTRLGCDGEDPFGPGGASILEAEWPGCARDLHARWGDGLAGFSTTQAAHDLGQLVRRAAGPGEPVFVYGVSYGTWWAHRYLHLFPGQPTAVALDSLCPPGGCSVALFDAGFDEVARHLLEACGADPFCAGKLGADPVARAERLYERLGRGHCAALAEAGLDAPTLRRVLASLLTSWELRVLVPALVYRYDRCAPGDVAALAHLLARMRGGGGAAAPMEAPRFSPVLNRHIGLSEMWGDPPPPPEEVAAWEEGLLAATGASATSAQHYPHWPRYAPDDLVARWASADVPLLMMNGTLDPQTPLSQARRAAERFTGPHQRFVAVAGGGHAVVRQAPTRAGTPCGVSLLASFLADPHGPLDLACLDDLLPVSFDGRPDGAAYLLGTPEVWENPRLSAGGRAAAHPPADFDRVRRFFERGPFGPGG